MTAVTAAQSISFSLLHPENHLFLVLSCQVIPVTGATNSFSATEFYCVHPLLKIRIESTTGMQQKRLRIGQYY
ncbi:hypothetical protein [Kistimonas asteriae]|uniref:hypothetical protein n=1 Tax=Kistimonas asteriae TaxID=517724 RepID=UPI001BA8EF54|nr:hypothetical protein [Kistimonas asteriae]